MKNRTILALVPIICTLMLGACSDNPSAPATVINHPVPTKGSSFIYRETQSDGLGNIDQGSMRTITSTLASTNGTVNGRSNVLSFTNIDGTDPRLSVESTHVATDARGDVATVLDVFNGNDVYNPGPVWVTLPVTSKGTHNEVLSDIGNTDIRWIYKASSKHLGSESMRIGSTDIAIERIRTTLTVTVSTGTEGDSFSFTVDWWYAPALHTFGKTTISSVNNDWHTTRQLTDYKLQ